MQSDTTTTRLSRAAVERAATAEGLFISANKPDMVAAYMRTLAQDALAYMTALEQIRDRTSEKGFANGTGHEAYQIAKAVLP